VTQRHIRMAAFLMTLCGACSAWSQTDPAPATRPASAPASQPATRPSIDSALPPVVPNVVLTINGSAAAEARQGWPLLIAARNPTATSATAPATAQPTLQINGSDGKAVAWALKSLPSSAGRFLWAVAPEQTLSAPKGVYTLKIRFGERADAKAAKARLTLTAATDALTPAQQEQAPYLLATYHARIGDTAMAKKVVDEALKADPEQVGLLMLRGDVLMASGEFSAAAAAYVKAMDARAALVKDDDNDPPLLLVAKLREAMRRADAGKELLTDQPK
jgi:tetratricopeptide (TPR) repeat protein